MIPNFNQGLILRLNSSCMEHWRSTGSNPARLLRHAGLPCQMKPRLSYADEVLAHLVLTSPAFKLGVEMGVLPILPLWEMWEGCAEVFHDLNA